MGIRPVITVLSILAVGAWTSLWGQGSVSNEELVRSRDDQERIAALQRDVAALEDLWSDELTVNAPNNTVSIGKRAAIDAFVRAGVINFSSFERYIEFIRIDGDFAFIMGLETVVPLTDAPAYGLVAGQPVQRRFTNIWKKEGDTWRLFVRHANVISTR